MIVRIKMTREANCAHYGVSKGSLVSIDLENEYLPICVANEIYENDSRTPMEAKKAQAIAARTYVLKHASEGTILDDTANAQAFKWKALSAIPNCAKAVKATEEEVLVHGGKLITAWYSNSNGGQTKTSREAWRANTPWTTTQDDPWDIAGREKWHVKGVSHSVGMSQTGAAYAASIGVNCYDILSFYYPNTFVVGKYGNGKQLNAPEKPEKGGESEMNDPDNKDLSKPEGDTPKESDSNITAQNQKTNIGLVAHAVKWIGMPYWYGTCCYKCTTTLLNSKRQQYPSHYTDNRMSQYQRNIRDGKSCADCVGLIKGYYWEDASGKVVYNKNTDVGTGGMYDRATIKGPIKTLPEVPGVIVYKSGHVGIYEGNGSVIEAKGFSYGVIRSKISGGPWTNWFACPFVSYAGYESQLIPAPVKTPYTAIVTTKSSPLNIWSDPSKKRSLLRVQKGDTITVTGYAAPVGWLKVEKNGVIGYSDGQYLTILQEAFVEDDAEDKEKTVAQLTADVDTPQYSALVTAGKAGVSLRGTPNLLAETLMTLREGTVLDVLEDRLADGFAHVLFGDIYGYVIRSSLERMNQEPSDVYDVRLAGITGDALMRVLRMVPGAEVTEGA